MDIKEQSSYLQAINEVKHDLEFLHHEELSTASEGNGMSSDVKRNIKQELWPLQSAGNETTSNCENRLVAYNLLKHEREIQMGSEDKIGVSSDWIDIKEERWWEETKQQPTFTLNLNPLLQIKKETLSEMCKAEDNTRSPRLISEAVYHDRGSQNSPEASQLRTSSGENTDKETTKPNKLSLNFNPACSIGNVESVDIQEYKCEVCAKKFWCRLKLKRHSICHSQQKSYKCETCGKCFTQKSRLKTHSLLHSGSKPYKCEHCQKCFTQNAHLKTHALIHSGTKIFKCEHCEKTFTHKSSFKVHTLLHTGTKPFKCDLCEKYFTRISHLKSHTLLHTVTKPYKCEHCDKCFTQESGLKRHLLLHTGAKPYKCEYCEKCFTQKSHLSRHILLHSGSKPYKCEHCVKCFTQKSDLSRHMSVHIGKKLDV